MYLSKQEWIKQGMDFDNFLLCIFGGTDMSGYPRLFLNGTQYILGETGLTMALMT